jgi:hypothetical protein
MAVPLPTCSFALTFSSPFLPRLRRFLSAAAARFLNATPPSSVNIQPISVCSAFPSASSARQSANGIPMKPSTLPAPSLPIQP